MSLADMYAPESMPASLVAAHADLDRIVDRVFDLGREADLLERQGRLFALYEQAVGDELRDIAGTRKSRRFPDG